MKKVSGIVTKSTEKLESDKAKRVYRAALDIIRRLDDIIKQKKAYRDVYLPEAIGLRNRLKDYCERLMFYDPLEYGRKAEELLWRKVYYDIIQLMKQNRRTTRLSNAIESAFRTHLSSATGYYHHLLFRLQVEFGLKLEGIVDFHFVPEPRSHKKNAINKKNDQDTKRIETWATRACHRCLVYLGDIARYQQEFDGYRSVILSRRYYYQALAMYPDIGVPHNQLGTLAGTSYCNIVAGYHYLRCLMCSSTFEGAHSNLNRLFEKNRKRYQEVIRVSPRGLPPVHQRLKAIKRCLVRFMHLLDTLQNVTQSDPKELQEYCQNTLQDFNLCMFYTPHNSMADDMYVEKPQYLSDDLVFKIVLMTMIAIYQLQQTGSKQVTAAIAFNLALFSHILNHAVIRLQAALYEAENPRKVLELEDNILTSSSEEEVEAPPADDRKGAEPGGSVEGSNKAEATGKNKKSKLAKLRRRRRRDSEQNDSVSSESDLSEGGDSSDLMTDTEEEDDLQYLDSSSSQSDHDDLMESQELPPGFAMKGLPHEDKDDIWAKSVILEETLTAGESSGYDDYPSTPVPNGYTLATEAGEFMLDSSVTDYLNNFSSDFLLSSTSLLDPFGSLKFGNFGSSQNGADDNVCQEVAQGRKEVRVPPGFDHDPETKHVVEITEKLAAFVIDTDTDTSMLATDTENGSDSETVPSDKGSVIDKSEEEQKRLECKIEVVAREGLLPTVKIICDWMKCHPHIVTACAQSSQSLWSRLSVLLNLLPIETVIATEEICENTEVRSMVEKAQGRTWVQGQPLQEDLNTQGLSFLKGTQKTMAFDVRKRMDISDKEEALIRICCLRKFGYNMAKMKNISLSYDPEKGMFYGPLQLAAQQDQKEAQEKMVDAETKRNQLMRDMAQLRLQAEVSQLEGTVQSTDQQPNFPPYLVPDTSVLCEKLTLLRQMNSSARFIIIIPLAVIDDLDHLKKESHGAREAIRWLEAEFRKGNRYVRAQKNNERCSSTVPRNIKKKDKDAWHFIQLVDCYKYMAQQSTECDPKAMVAILTNYNLNNSDVPPRVQQAISTAQQEGIDIQYVDEFHAKWKELWKSKG